MRVTPKALRAAAVEVDPVLTGSPDRPAIFAVNASLPARPPQNVPADMPISM